MQICRVLYTFINMFIQLSEDNAEMQSFLKPEMFMGINLFKKQ